MAAEAVQVGRHDRFDRPRLQPEALQGAAPRDGRVRHDVVAAQHLELVARHHQRLREQAHHQAGQRLGQGGRRLHGAGRHRHERAAALHRGEDVFHQLAEGFDAGAAELVDGARLGAALHGGRDGVRDVADEDGLEARVPAADQRQGGREARHGGEAVEEVVLRAEHDRGPQDHRVRVDLAHGGLAPGLAAGIDGSGPEVRPDGRHLDEAAHAGRPRGLGHGPSALDVDGLEALAAALGQDADEVHRDLGVAQRRGERGGVAHVGLHGLDLTDAAERLEIVGEVGAAAAGPDAKARAGQRPDDVAPQKARAAEDGHQPIGREIGSGHHLLHERRQDL